MMQCSDVITADRQNLDLKWNLFGVPSIEPLEKKH